VGKKSQKRAPIKKGHIFKIRLHPPAAPKNLRESSRTVRRRTNRSASGSAAVGLWSTPVPEVTQLGRWTPGATEDASVWGVS